MVQVYYAIIIMTQELHPDLMITKVSPLQACDPK